MNKILLLALIAGLPLLSHASDLRINVDSLRIKSGNTTISIGEQDKRGYYWDGGEWRDPVYWEKHHGKGKGQGQGQGYHCPPGQAKKGNC
jgi:hypothetical protein